MNAPHPSDPLPQDIQRWTAKRKAAVILDILKGNTTAQDVARKFDLTVAEVERWQAEFLQGAESRLRSNPKDAEQQFEAERQNLYAKIGQLTLERDAAKKQFTALTRGSREETL